MARVAPRARSLLGRIPCRRALLALAIVALAVVVCRHTPIGAHLGPDALDDLSGTPYAAPALVALYVITFALAIPGSALFVAAGFVFAPPLATLLAVVGATAGSLVAHGLGRVLGAEAAARWRGRRGFSLLERSLDFPGLLTLRLLPGFPHSVVNYGSGVARAPLRAFIPAAVIGLGAKAYLYASITHRSVRTGAPLDLFQPEIWASLAGLAALTFGARLVARRRAARSLARPFSPVETCAGSPP